MTILNQYAISRMSALHVSLTQSTGENAPKSLFEIDCLNCSFTHFNILDFSIIFSEGSHIELLTLSTISQGAITSIETLALICKLEWSSDAPAICVFMSDSY